MAAKAALFDLDHTLVSGNASFLFGKFLYQIGALSFRDMLFLVRCYGRHKFYNLSLPLLHNLCFTKLFAGRDRSEILDHVEAFLDRHLLPMLFLPVAERLEAAQRGGDYTAILSNSPDFLVESISRRLGVDHHLGTRYVTNEKGVFVSVTDFISGAEKAAYVKELQARGIGREETTAYSDSRLDIPFLQAAGHAVAVRPDRFLRKLSLQGRWEIIK